MPGRERKEEALGDTRVTDKCQITVPVRARSAFNIARGDRLLFLKKDGELVVRKVELVAAKSP